MMCTATQYVFFSPDIVSSRLLSFSSLLVSSLWSPSSLPSCPTSTSTSTSQVVMKSHLLPMTPPPKTRAVPSLPKTAQAWTTRSSLTPHLRPTPPSQKENRFGTRVVMQLVQRASSSLMHSFYFCPFCVSYTCFLCTVNVASYYYYYYNDTGIIHDCLIKIN